VNKNIKKNGEIKNNEEYERKKNLEYCLILMGLSIAILADGKALV
jgi:hypothetical protein